MRMSPAQKQTNGARKPKAFTLIELLVVVAVIAILAAIAVPNFLEAQVRSKVSRVKADLRTLALGLEAYAVDNNEYPSTFRTALALTSPVAYLTDSQVKDPFAVGRAPGATWSDLIYSYGNFGEAAVMQSFVIPNVPDPADQEAVASLRWSLSGRGPDQDFEYQDPNANYTFTPASIASSFQRMLNGDIIYDPTNGTTSNGDITLTQKGFLSQALHP